MTDWIGRRVTLAELPPWVGDLPHESQIVFRYCVGRTYRVIDVDGRGNLVLDVSADIDAQFGGTMNDIRVESAYVVPAR